MLKYFLFLSFTSVIALFIIFAGKIKTETKTVNTEVADVKTTDAPHISTVNKYLQKNCFKCHDEDLQKGDFRLDNISSDLTNEDVFKLWAKIYEAVETGQMPPKKKPSENDTQSFLTELKNSLKYEERKEIAANGRSTWRRLTAREYENSLRDLFDMPYLNIARSLPEDAQAHGFNKVDEVLDVSSVHLKNYMKVAESIIKAAIIDLDKPKVETHHLQIPYHPKYAYRPGDLKEDGSFWLFIKTISSRKTVSGRIHHQIKTPGYYDLSFFAQTIQKKSPHILKISTVATETAQDNEVHLKFIAPPHDKKQHYKFRVWLEKGARLYFTVPENRSKKSGHTITSQPGISIKGITLEGPFLENWPIKRHAVLWGDLKYQKGNRWHAAKILPPKHPYTAMRELLEKFLPKAFRRPVSRKEVELFVRVAKERMNDKDDFYTAMIAAYTSALCSPPFLFKQESRGELDQLSLANRLSYFLWNSPPDETLVQKAAKGQLSSQQIRDEVERLLSDKKADRFIEDFNKQWLNLDELYATSPDSKLYPEGTSTLVESMEMETNAFVRHLIDKDLSVENIIDSDFALLNSRLAQHYKVKGVKGMDFKPVKLPKDSPRGGIITQASVMKLSANGTVTSPINRGVWFLENILGKTPPPPPNAVPAFDPEATAGVKTLKEGLAEHRSNSACAGCHKIIDPAGMAFESFDPIGGFREKYRIYHKWSYKHGNAVDPSDKLLTGEKYSNIKEFKRLILKQKNDVLKNLINKLVTYSTGRPVSFSDEEEVKKIIQTAHKSKLGFRSLIHAVTQSTLFTRK